MSVAKTEACLSPIAGLPRKHATRAWLTRGGKSGLAEAELICRSDFYRHIRRRKVGLKNETIFTKIETSCGRRYDCTTQAENEEVLILEW